MRHIRIAPMRLALATLAVAGLAITSACAPGSSGSSESSSTSAAAGDSTSSTAGESSSSAAGQTSESSSPEAPAVNTDPATMGDITLNVWDQESRGAQNAQMSELVSEFQKQYPNITIKRNSQSFDDLNKTLPLALLGAKDKVPDVVEANNGRNILGAFVTGKQVIPLDKYADAYGWADRYPESVLALSSYSADGKTFGSGSLFGLSQGGEIVGIYYNKKVLADAGVSLPTTWDEFTASLKTLKDAGQTPIMLGDAEKWPAIHVFGPVQGAHTDAAKITDLALGNAGGDWNSDTNIAAATELADWAKSGYFNSDALGTKDQPIAERFANGEGAYMIAGSWNNEIVEASKNASDYGFMAPPPVKADEGRSTTGGTSLPFAITSGSQHPDAAAAFINFITSDAAMKVYAEKGNMPVLHTAELAPAEGVGKDTYEAYEAVTTKGHLLPYLDYATPTFSDTLGNALQGLLQGTSAPKDFTQALQTDYAAFTSKNG